VAIALDASTPAKVAQTGIVATVTTASFTPPAGALLVACAWCSQNATGMTFSFSDTSSGSWTKDLERNSANSGGYQSVATIAHSTSSGASMTVTATVSGSFLPTLKVLVLTGVDMVSPIGGTANQGSTSTSFATTGYTNVRASSFGVVVACNNAANLVTSNDATAYENGPASNGHYGLYGYKSPLGAAGATTTHHLECSGTVGMHVVQAEFKAALTSPAQSLFVPPYQAVMRSYYR
jgi:hypothetical protein